MNKTTLLVLTAASAICPELRSQQPPRVRELGKLSEFTANERPNRVVAMPNGRVVLYATDTTLFAYDLARKRNTLISRGMHGGLAISPRGDRIAWNRAESLGSGPHIWAMPVDPQSGLPTGPAGMVSPRRGFASRFSPDGKSLAFISNSGVWNVAPDTIIVVPATGGPERRLATYQVPVLLDWSSDGKSVLAKTFAGNPEQWVDRIPVDGGRSERVFTIPEAVGDGGEILSTDGRIVFYRAAWPAKNARWDEERISYITTSGARGSFRIPMNAIWPLMGWTPGTAHHALPLDREPTIAYTLDVATGKVRELLAGGVDTRDPSWSPDGRRIAVQRWNGSRYDIVVMNKDGSNRRTFAVPLDVQDGALKWSPDGRFLLFRTGGRTDLALLDLTNGKSRVLAYRPGTSEGWIWRPDSKAVILARNKDSSHRPHAFDQKLAIYEVQLDGTERLLRDLTTEFPEHIGATFVSDKLLVLGSRDRYVVIPVDGGPARTLPVPGVGRNSGFNASHTRYSSTDGRRLLIRTHVPGDRGASAFEVMTSNGDSVRRVALPFVGDPGARHRPVFVRGSEQAIFLAQATASDPAERLFLVPFDGGAPRLLATLPTPMPWYEQFKLSPDGTTLVYTIRAPSFYATVYDLDLSNLLREGQH
jgi:Tol biopolymer transport system component